MYMHIHMYIFIYFVCIYTLVICVYLCVYIRTPSSSGDVQLQGEPVLVAVDGYDVADKDKLAELLKRDAYRELVSSEAASEDEDYEAAWQVPRP